MPRKSEIAKPANGYIAYYRVSTARQGESGLGLAAQREAVLRLAKSGPIHAEYTEVESGKRHDNRPQLLAALADAKRRKAVLLIAKLDRLARNVHFISGLMESGIDFLAADMPLANRLTVHILAAVAEHEREMISARTKAGLASVLREIEANGFRISKSGRRITQLGNPNWESGIAAANKAKLKPAQRALEVSAMIGQLRSEGATLQAIADKLNALGLKTPSKAQWHPSSVRAALLKGPALSGAASIPVESRD